MHVTQIKEVVRILEGVGTTNKELQASILGYIVGIEAPIGLNTNDPDDNLEWNSFFKELPGEINEHFIINLSFAQDVANLTLQYRQAVADGSDKVEELAARFLKLTGAAFGLIGNEGIVRQVRKVLKQTVTEKRAGIEERMAARREAAEVKE
jgi:hypothetical protein|nr:MAG TPA: hypothetical protein [Caudoviricetes sp.]